MGKSLYFIKQVPHSPPQSSSQLLCVTEFQERVFAGKMFIKALFSIP